MTSVITVGSLGTFQRSVLNRRESLSATAAISRVIWPEHALRGTGRLLWSAISVMRRGILPENALAKNDGFNLPCILCHIQYWRSFLFFSCPSFIGPICLLLIFLELSYDPLNILSQQAILFLQSHLIQSHFLALCRVHSNLFYQVVDIY